MRKTSTSISLFVLAIVLVSSSLLSFVSAQNTPMTDEQIGRIRANCVSAKNTLNQLHASDALLRVNRGQIYESMSTKLMTRFNNRADSDHFGTKNLVETASDYAATLTTFREDYKSYEVQLVTALNIDCSKEPVSFFDAVAIARTRRAQVHADVVRLHQHIDSYAAALGTFTADFNRQSGANK